MDTVDTVQDMKDGIEAMESGLRQRLGRYQSLCIQLLGARAIRDRDWLTSVVRDVAGEMIVDIDALQWAASRLEPRTVGGSGPTPHQAWLETRVEELNQEVADIDAQRAAAVKEAAELRESLGPWQERVQHLETVRTELLNQRNEATDLLRERTADLEGSLARLQSQLGHLLEKNQRLHEEVEALRNVGGWVDTTVKTTYEQALADRMAAQSIAEAEVAPEPDQNHTETIPATVSFTSDERASVTAVTSASAPKKNRLSEEARQRASERMKAMQARKRAAREAAAMPAPVEAVAVIEEIEADKEPAAPVAAEIVPVAGDNTPSTAIEEANPKPSMGDRMDAASAELQRIINTSSEISDAILSDIARRYDLTKSGVDRLLSGIMTMRHIRGNGVAAEVE